MVIYIHKVITTIGGNLQMKQVQAIELDELKNYLRKLYNESVEKCNKIDSLSYPANSLPEKQRIKDLWKARGYKNAIYDVLEELYKG